MLTNLIIGLPTMVVCLFLQSLLLVAAVRYYHGHERLVRDASFWSSFFNQWRDAAAVAGR